MGQRNSDFVKVVAEFKCSDNFYPMTILKCMLELEPDAAPVTLTRQKGNGLLSWQALLLGLSTIR